MLDFGYYNMDCLDGMKEFPDNYFDLAIADPPYGSGGQQTNGRGSGDGSTDTDMESFRREIRQIQVNHAFGGRFKRYNRGVSLVYRGLIGI